MNRAVELEGNNAATVANSFLIAKGILPKDAKIAGNTAKDLFLAMGTLDDISGSGGKALRATRTAFPKRRVRIVRVPNLGDLVNSDQARVALLGAEAFYNAEGGGLPVLDKTVEALGVVGYRMAHILSAANSPVSSISQMKKLGVGPSGGTSHRSAAIILNGLGLIDKIEMIPGNLENQAKMLQKNQLNGILLMVEQGHRQVTDLMRTGTFKLISLTGWQEGNAVMRFPFFRLSRIAAKTYPDQKSAIETVSAQTVLAGPSPKEDFGTGNAGPVAIAATGQPVSDYVILRLNEALSMEEKIDPTIPSASVLRPRKEVREKRIQSDYFTSGANALVLVVIVYLIYLFLAEEKQTRRPR